jgi:hypothetical protein
LKVGDKVLLSTKYLNLKHSKRSRKFLPKWIGPFEVVQVVGPVAYELKMNPGWRVHPVFHVLLLEPYRESGWVQPHHLQLKWKALLSMRWILEHRFWGIKNPKAYYKVAWKGLCYVGRASLLSRQGSHGGSMDAFTDMLAV